MRIPQRQVRYGCVFECVRARGDWGTGGCHELVTSSMSAMARGREEDRWRVRGGMSGADGDRTGDGGVGDALMLPCERPRDRRTVSRESRRPAGMRYGFARRRRSSTCAAPGAVRRSRFTAVGVS